MRYRLRTLLILFAVLPPFLAWWGWPAMKRILWPPKPTIQLNVNILTFDFAFPIAVPPQADPTAAFDFAFPIALPPQADPTAADGDPFAPK
jgi:hypothetical protein